jgi:hypothetical protein
MLSRKHEAQTMTPQIWHLKGTLLRWLCPLFFESIGRGTMFAGSVRLPMPRRRVRLGTGCMIGERVFFQTGRDSTIVSTQRNLLRLSR